MISFQWMMFEHRCFQFLEAGLSVPFCGAWFFVACKYQDSSHILFPVSAGV
jgi:hypothetical protein